MSKSKKIIMGWFYSFKLHLIINDHGGIISIKVMTDHVDDRKPVSEMCNLLAGLIAYLFQPKKPSIKRIRFYKQALMQILS
nr:transposase [Candidatus Enterovibrio escacola]